jgi:hypothetical protein
MLASIENLVRIINWEAVVALQATFVSWRDCVGAGRFALYLARLRRRRALRPFSAKGLFMIVLVWQAARRWLIAGFAYDGSCANIGFGFIVLGLS